jgi:hypothetical protein
MATMNMGLLGDLFGGGTSALSEYLTPQQQESMQRQALLSTAAALLQAGGPSATPISLGQALGAGLQAGTSSYGKAQEGAIQQLLVRQKLDEAKRAQTTLEAYQRFIAGQPTQGQAITPEQAISMPGMPVGPTVDRAALIGQPGPSVTPDGRSALTQEMRNVLRFLPPDKGIPEVMKLMQPQEVTGDIFTSKDGKQYQRTKTGQFVPIPTGLEFSQETVGEPFRAADGNFYLRTKTGGFVPAPQGLAAKPVGTPQQVMGADRKPTLVQMYDDGTYKPITGVSPLIPPEKIDQGGFSRFVNPYEIKPGTVFPKTITPQVVGGPEAGYFIVGGGGGGGLTAPMPAPAGAPGAVAAPAVPGAAPRAPVVPAAGAAAPTGPQPIIPGTGKAFGNEKDLRSEFTAQIKPYVELAQAYQKIEVAAKNPSAAGDIALVYGFMKVLDPGSVVREGEFATAANAGGIPDGIRNLYNKALTGSRLGSTEDETSKIRNDFLAQSRNIIESQRVLSGDLIDRYTNVAQGYKLDANQIVFDPFKRIKTPAQIAADAAGSPAGTTKAAPAPSYVNQFNLIPRPK